MPQKSATIALLNSGKILLLKRGSTAPWQPNKYCLVGGGVDDNESLIDAAIRETKEEIDLSLDKLSIKELNVCYYNGYSKIVFYSFVKNISVNLNYEHSEYLWASYDDCMKLYDAGKLVPRLKKTVKELQKHGVLT